ncbi:hypothetical protein BDR26DRAFT_871448 [Obelidium mucronatum]|nr:hypothetical protein BDR26DRAFT_871448 [Obelidium mucronatum]
MTAPTVSATSMAFLEDYLDTIEALPLELSRNFTLMRELGGMAEEVEQTIKSETKGIVNTLKQLPTGEERTQKIVALTAIFKEYLKHGEDKVALAVQTYDMVDRHIRRLDDDLAKYEDEQMTGPRAHQQFYTPIATEMMASASYAGEKRGAPSIETPGKRQKFTTKPNKPSTPQPEPAPPNNGIKKDSKRVPASTAFGASTTAAYKGKSTSKVVEVQPVPALKGSPDDLPIDPNEPRYCICNQYSFGDMIGCDNSDCEIEWFHYGCVGLTEKVEGSWFCPQCRDRANKKTKRRV